MARLKRPVRLLCRRAAQAGRAASVSDWTAEGRERVANSAASSVRCQESGAAGRVRSIDRDKVTARQSLVKCIDELLGELNVIMELCVDRRH
jgi:hypothetical protein